MGLTDAELTERRNAMPSPRVATEHLRGYERMYRMHVTQAERGCDFDFMAPDATRGVTPI